MGQEFGYGLARGFFSFSVWHQLVSFPQLVAWAGLDSLRRLPLQIWHVGAHRTSSQHDISGCSDFYIASSFQEKERANCQLADLWSFSMSLLVTVGQSKSKGQPRFRELGYKHHILMGGVTCTQTGKDLMAAFFGRIICIHINQPPQYLLIFDFIYKVLLWLILSTLYLLTCNQFKSS